MSKACQHATITGAPSKHASVAGYRVRTARQRMNATEGTAVKIDEQAPVTSTFPLPLILPEDELAEDPDYDAQPVSEWIDEKHHRRLTKQRRKIYLVPAPKISTRVNYMESWTRPQLKTPKKDLPSEVKIEDILEYLQAFYCGLDVKLFTKSGFEFVPWEENNNGQDASQSVGLNTGSEIIRIQARCATRGERSLFRGQLNLNDLLDAAIAILPKDAFALLMLVDHDMYESEEDDFCCGRAYGGSRVAVVSTARYSEWLNFQHSSRKHPWPISHCTAFVEAECDDAQTQQTKKAKRAPSVPAPIKIEADTAMTNATRAWLSVPDKPRLPRPPLWLGRICKTASHELGHCLGIDHCVYYACIMQGTANLSEDMRQPPYLCPVDLAKVLATTGASMIEHYQALLKFCERFEGQDQLFTAYAAWLRFRLVEIRPAAEDDSISVIALSSD